MRRPNVRPSILWSAAAIAIALLAGCGSGGSRSAATAGAPGTTGVTYLVYVSRPVGGTIRSTDGLIDCGPSGGSANACGPVAYAWTATVTLNAIPDDGNMLGTWAGDCSSRGPCVLGTSVAGADKTVAAVFGKIGEAQHGNFTDPAVHGSAYVDYVKGSAEAFACDRCHGATWNGLGIALSCNACHEKAGFPEWRNDCGFCHGFPPDTGAHRAHFGLSGASVGAAYGDVGILEDRYPAATKATAAATSYAFGCGNCHPVGAARHMDGSLDVDVASAGAPGGSLKARGAPSAAYNSSTHTCNGLYCHSTGTASPAFKATPDWRTGKFAAETRCAQCHDDPPAYAGGNSHPRHVLSSPGVTHDYPTMNGGSQRGPKHGGNPLYAEFIAANSARGFSSPLDAAPMTCQTCHFETVDPANTTRAADGTPTGYYYLDTGGGEGWRCAACHRLGGIAAVGYGKALPLRHVNGTRDVRFDSRTGDHDGPAGQSLGDVVWIPAIPQGPGAAVKPAKPYWITDESATNWGCKPGGQVIYFGYGGTAYCPPDGVFVPNWYYFDPATDPFIGTYCRNYPADCPPAGWQQASWGTISFSLAPATYDPQRKTCANVGCHLGSWSYPEYNVPTWGVRARNCFPCHRNPP